MNVDTSIGMWQIVSPEGEVKATDDSVLTIIDLLKEGDTLTYRENSELLSVEAEEYKRGGIKGTLLITGEILITEIYTGGSLDDFLNEFMRLKVELLARLKKIKTKTKERKKKEKPAPKNIIPFREVKNDK